VLAHCSNLLAIAPGNTCAQAKLASQDRLSSALTVVSVGADAAPRGFQFGTVVRI
jgi:hypothetical protein